LISGLSSSCKRFRNCLDITIIGTSLAEQKFEVAYNLKRKPTKIKKRKVAYK
jgi:hypothetical protein